MGPRTCAFASLLVAAVLCLAGGSRPQEPAANPPITAQSGQPAVNTEVRNGEVFSISGADLLVRLESGRMEHFVLPETAKFNVDGQVISMDELKPGMRLTQTITTLYRPELSPPALPSQAVQSSESTPATTPGINPPAPSEGAEPSKKLPATATALPLLGLAGLGSLLTGWVVRKRC